MFVDALDEKLDLARVAHRRLASVPGLEVPWAPNLSLVAFRPRDSSDEDVEAMLRRINESGRVWLSSAPIRGRTYIRMCVLSHRSTRGRMDEAVEIIRDAVP